MLLKADGISTEFWRHFIRCFNLIHNASAGLQMHLPVLN